MKKCMNCNREFDDSFVFCGVCGKELVNAEEPNGKENFCEKPQKEKREPEIQEPTLKQVNPIIIERDVSSYYSNSGYSALINEYEVFFKESKFAESYIENDPSNSVFKVNSILEALAKKYYSDATAEENTISNDEFKSSNQNRKSVKDDYYTVINNLYDEQLITSKIKYLLIEINTTRNDTKKRNAKISSEEARNYYNKGAQAVGYLANAIKAERLNRFGPLKAHNEELYRWAISAQRGIECGDLKTTLVNLGDIIKQLCCELFAVYINVPYSSEIKYGDAIRYLKSNRLIDENVVGVIDIIANKRNIGTHNESLNNIEDLADSDFCKKEFELAGKITIYLLNKISNAENERNDKIFQNAVKCKKIYRTMVEWFAENNAEYCNTRWNANNCLYIGNQSANEKLHDGFYSFEDYLNDFTPPVIYKKHSNRGFTRYNNSMSYSNVTETITVDRTEIENDEYYIKKLTEIKEQTEIKDRENIAVFDCIHQEIIQFFLSNSSDWCRITWNSNECTQIGFSDVKYVINKDAFSFEEYLQKQNPPISFHLENNGYNNHDYRRSYRIQRSAIENDEKYIDAEKQKKNAIRKRKAKKNITIASIAASVALCIAIFLLIQFIYTSRPEYRFVSSVTNANSYEAAKAAETLGLGSDKTLDLTKQLIVDTKSDFANDKIDNTKAKNTIACIKELKIPGTEQEIADAEKFIGKMQESHKAYYSGEYYYNARYYINAAEEYSKVLLDDGHYESAQSKIAEIKDPCISEALNSAANSEKSDVISAYITLNRIADIYDDSTLKNKFDEYQKIATPLIKSKLDESAKFAAETDYIQAIESVKNYKEDPVFLNAYNKYKKSYCEYLTNLKNENINKDWKQVKNAVTEAAEVFSNKEAAENEKDENDVNFLKLKDEVDSKEPDTLEKLTILDKSSFSIDNTCDKFVSNGTVYSSSESNILILSSGDKPGYGIYALNNNYSHLRGILAIYDYTLNPAIYEDEEALNGTITFYGGDENKDYNEIAQFNYSKEDEPNEIDVDLGGYKYLKIELKGNKHKFYFPTEQTEVCLVNCYLYQ